MRTLSHEDGTTAYRDVGEGPPVLLVHGHPFDGSMWDPQVEHLAAAGRRVIVPDLRGYGRSAVTAGEVTLDVFARDLAALLDHLDVERVVLGGLSMGGQIVMEFHRLFPERISGLLLAAASARADDTEGRQSRVDTAERIEWEGMAGYSDELLPRMIAPTTVATDPQVVAHVRRMMRGAPATGAAAALRGRARRQDYVASLAGVSVPTLIVVGTEDDFTPVAEAELMHERITGSTLAVIEGAGHLPNLERTAEFHEALACLLTASDTTREATA
ncbi:MULTISPECIES: alpha/beta fold hydrolase [Actinoalloteichus]|uniref:Hydrolase or acyltransferase of alpha/beta superfamily n=1 Tax=Actinoalloteichus fjordicus TaxID=1612552 RepID=A0AAC9LEE8_9PSEU|nr:MULTISPECIES: alpha/beta fold hydrolase [Actinoalloteichus]APU14744.1 putative hydrolase or acyltransferase of alpha/beta superfamily [Actinoalloteichus fjordicus]APU20713.1 putative hydrolase or acyltransferase of alpha/beta superfamily [Actinoalloteichus sp. GBA129-24]